MAAVVAPPSASGRAATPVDGVDAAALQAKDAVVDTILTERPDSAAFPARVEVFPDVHGHRITLATDIPSLDLRQYADLLAATLHRAEIEQVVAEVVPRDQVGTICGHPSAEACYGSRTGSREGYMWIPHAHEDLAHIVVHEYGHHVDNQLLNLAHLDRCSYASDGSRNWFFARNVSATTLSCAPGTEWDRLLPEVFAEDYAWLVGNRTWVIRGTAPPTAGQTSALAYDFAHPFAPRTLAFRPFVRRGRVVARRFSSDDWLFFLATLRSPTRGVNLDLYLYRRGARTAIARSARPGSRERIERRLRPGAYEVRVRARTRGGRAYLRLFLR